MIPELAKKSFIPPNTVKNMVILGDASFLEEFVSPFFDTLQWATLPGYIPIQLRGYFKWPFSIKGFHRVCQSYQPK